MIKRGLAAFLLTCGLVAGTASGAQSAAFILRAYPTAGDCVIGITIWTAAAPGGTIYQGCHRVGNSWVFTASR